MPSQFGLNTHTLTALRQVFARFSDIDRVIIYGSRAKGTYKPGSDIDLTLIATPLGKVDLTVQFEIEEAIESLMLPYQCDLSIFEMIDNPSLLAHIQRAGKTFYER